MFSKIPAAYSVCVVAVTGLLLSQKAQAAPPAAVPGPKAPVKAAPKPSSARPVSGLVGVNRQLLYSTSSTFSQSRRVMRTEQSNVLRGGAPSLWDSDRSEEARRLQRRAEQRARMEQQRQRLQKQSRDEALRKASSL